MNIYFYALIFITGALSIYTDITTRKIKNNQLLVISSIAIIFYIIFFAVEKLSISLPLILNPLISVIIGFILYLSGLWKAGDGKLFLVYALLLPTNRYSSILPLSCFVLFFNTFLISFLFILPLFFKDVINNKDKIIKEVISRNTLIFFSRIFLIAFCISWIIGPILNFFPLKNNIFLNFVLLYIGYLSIHRFIGRTKYKLLIVPVFAIGFILRYIFMPDSFSFTNIIGYLKFLLGFSMVFYILRKILDLEKEKGQRIPLTPFMFLGAILSNTNFLWWAIKILSILRR